jgi:carboxyl-terminal processing protease
MTSRTRLLVLAASTPVIVFALVGGFLGQTMTREETYQPLRAFDDVVSLVLNNYVEEVDVEDAMRGAMNGLADNLDPDSAYLTPQIVMALESGSTQGGAGVGLELSRQYYLRVIATREGSPAAEAGILPGDFLRAIDGRPTRDMSIFEGTERLRGEPGTQVSVLVIRGNAAEPHQVQLLRETNTTPTLSTRLAGPETGYLRLESFSTETPAAVEEAIVSLRTSGATQFILDLRGTSRGDLDNGLATARLFVDSGTLGHRESKDVAAEAIVAEPGDGAITAPVVLLVDLGTGGAAEIFAAALRDNDRAELVGQRTLGRAARQQLVKLPDGSGLWLSYMHYLSPESEVIHQTGLAPDVVVANDNVEFGAQAPADDQALERALERLTARPPA